ncbi:RDD family protein [Ekhidna sp.]|uniref:RDD family protein n=1 Tax=Ekhidna sp. TaxID=2608089 RepID=UPI003CCC1EA9
MKETNRYADFWKRLLAHNIDLLPILFLFYVITIFFPSPEYDYLIVGSVYFGYYILFESSKLRATPGKLLIKIRIVNDDKSRSSIIQVTLRNLSKVLSLLICFGGFIMIFFDKKNRALHDYIGGTVVLFDEE